VEMDKPRQLRSNAEGGVSFEQRPVSNGMSKPGADRAAGLLSRVRHRVGRAMKIRACSPVQGNSASLMMVTHDYIAITFRDRPWS
jgi:hypothetical protein